MSLCKISVTYQWGEADMERKCDDVRDRSANNPSTLIALDRLAEGFSLVGDRRHAGDAGESLITLTAKPPSGPFEAISVD